MRFILAQTNRFYLQGTNNRFVHMATIHYGVREFIFLMDILTSKTYIEEITGGSLIQIEDDELWQGLANFLEDKGVNQFKAVKK